MFQKTNDDLQTCLCCGGNLVGNNTIHSTKYAIKVCTDCGTGFTVPRYDDTSMLYESNDYYDGKTILQSVAKLSRSLLYFFRRNYINSIVKRGNIFDFGCGDGGFAASFSSKDWERYGFDTSQVACKKASAKGVKILTKQEMEGTEFQSFFDVITMNHVLEHLQNPFKTILLLQSMLKKNGKLYIEVPNFQSVGTKLFKRKWPPVAVMPYHLTHFTDSGVIQLLKKGAFPLYFRPRSVIKNMLSNNNCMKMYFDQKYSLPIWGIIFPVLLTPIIFATSVFDRENIELVFRKQ